MKINAKQASFLYLLLFNHSEAGLEYQEEAEEKINSLLRINNYTDDPIFDDDGFPNIDWNSYEPGFKENWFIDPSDGAEFRDDVFILGISDLLDKALEENCHLEAILNELDAQNK